MIWHLAPGLPADVLGLIPEFLSACDPRPAREQLHERYAHGGGWRPFQGFALHGIEPAEMELEYPGDPRYQAMAWTQLRSETIILFRFAWVAIMQANGAWEVARMD